MVNALRRTPVHRQIPVPRLVSPKPDNPPDLVVITKNRADTSALLPILWGWAGVWLGVREATAGDEDRCLRRRGAAHRQEDRCLGASAPTDRTTPRREPRFMIGAE
jgi:hypothetical protein